MVCNVRFFLKKILFIPDIHKYPITNTNKSLFFFLVGSKILSYFFLCRQKQFEPWIIQKEELGKNFQEASTVLLQNSDLNNSLAALQG